MKLSIGRIRELIREGLKEVDTDPSNNPGRPADPYEYLGMRPDPKAPMSHPGTSGGVVPGDTDDGVEEDDEN